MKNACITALPKRFVWVELPADLTQIIEWKETTQETLLYNSQELYQKSLDTWPKAMLEFEISPN